MIIISVITSIITITIINDNVRSSAAARMNHLRRWGGGRRAAVGRLSREGSFPATFPFSKLDDMSLLSL